MEVSDGAGVRLENLTYNDIYPIKHQDRDMRLHIPVVFVCLAGLFFFCLVDLYQKKDICSDIMNTERIREIHTKTMEGNI